ncbi:hypothetical protein [Asaia prunellae]|uniref:hypothetical protein n=1 Tax=Asaia prunellae TaxID=610245 RepID=UPI000ACA7F73|nr:hypothetical protein [Asaia prunellae]
MLTPPLPFSPDVETPEKDEQHVIQGIIDGMVEQSRVVGKREGRMVRASHAKPTALVVGTLDVAPHLPGELAQGVFATSGQYPVAARFAQARERHWAIVSPFTVASPSSCLGSKEKNCQAMKPKRRISSWHPGRLFHRAQPQVSCVMVG